MLKTYGQLEMFATDNVSSANLLAVTGIIDHFTQ